MNTDKTLIELRMARRNNISKIPITAACSFALLALMAVACPPPIFPTYKVPASFRVVLKSQSQPMAGVNLNLYREEGADNLTRHLLLTPSSDADGSVKIQNLDPGNYFLETTGLGAGSAAHLVVQAANSSDTRDVIEFEWPSRTPLRTRTLKGRISSTDSNSPFTNVELKIWTRDSPAPIETINAGPNGEFAFKTTEPGLYFLYITATYHNSSWKKDVQTGGQFPVMLIPDDSDSRERLNLDLTDSSCGLLYTQPWNSVKPETDAAQN